MIVNDFDRRSFAGSSPSSVSRGTENPAYFENADMHREYDRLRQQGDTPNANRVQWEIALANQQLIWWFAKRLWKKWTPATLSVQDLAHYGIFGILRAIEKFNPVFETKLSTYASWWIRRSIESAIFENGPTIRIPEYKINQKAQIDAAALELLEQGLEPTLDSVARQLNLREDERCKSNPARQRMVWTSEDVDAVNSSMIQVMGSLDKPVYTDSQETLHSVVPDQRPQDAYGDPHASPFLRQGFRRIVQSSGLSVRDQLVLDLYFYGQSHNKDELVRLFGAAREQVLELLDAFETKCETLFKLVQVKRQLLFGVLRYCRMPEKQRQLIVAAANDALARTEALLGESDTGMELVIGAFAQHPGLAREIEILVTLQDGERMMLGVYFCGDDLSKQELGILCNVSRERVRQIVDAFTRKFRGPLSRLFLRDYHSPEEVCRSMLARQCVRLQGEIDTYLETKPLRNMAEMLRQYYIEHLSRKDMSQTSGLPAGTVSNRLKRVATKLRAVPESLGFLFCGGITSLRPKEVFARQVWDCLSADMQKQCCRELSDDEMLVLRGRLALDGAHLRMKALADRMGRSNPAEISVLLDRALDQFVEQAGQFFLQAAE